MTKFVAYYRVSTQQQGKSGLGLESQRSIVANYVVRCRGDLIGEYSEIESGVKNDRPELLQALRSCRLKGATLVIAKLDRLSRNRRFLMELQDSSVKFVCCDMPDANHFTIGLMANIADYERQLISERTKAALKAAKDRGVKLGNPKLALVRNTDPSKATEVRVERANAYKREMFEVIREIDSDGSMTATEIAFHLNDAGYQTPRGGLWSHVQVNRVLQYG